MRALMNVAVSSQEESETELANGIKYLNIHFNLEENNDPFFLEYFGACLSVSFQCLSSYETTQSILGKMYCHCSH